MEEMEGTPGMNRLKDDVILESYGKAFILFLRRIRI